MRKVSLVALSLLLVLSMAACKKEEVKTQGTESSVVTKEPTKEVQKEEEVTEAPEQQTEEPIGTETMLDSGDYLYKNLENGGVIACKYIGVGNEGYVLEVPETLDGKPILVIGEDFLGSAEMNYGDTMAEVILPENVVELMPKAFYDIPARKIVLPNSLEIIGDECFAGSVKLEEVVLGNNLKKIGKLAFEYCWVVRELNLPDTVEEIGEKAFEHCNRILKLDVPKNLKVITGEQLSFNDALTEINILGDTELDAYDGGIPNTEGVLYHVVEGSQADEEVSDWHGDTDFYLTVERVAKGEELPAVPKGAKEAEGYVYVEGENGLSIVKYTGKQGKDVTITVPETIEGKKVVEIGRFAFTNVEAKKIVLSKGVTVLKRAAFGNCDAEEIVLSDTVKTIEPFCFHGSMNLKSVKLGKGVESVGDYAFGWCVNLKEADMVEGVKEMGYAIYESCKSLEKIVFPKSLNKLNLFASVNVDSYMGDVALKDIYINCADTFTEDNWESACIYSYTELTYHVKKGSITHKCLKSMQEKEPDYYIYTIDAK